MPQGRGNRSCGSGGLVVITATRCAGNFHEFVDPIWSDCEDDFDEGLPELAVEYAVDDWVHAGVKVTEPDENLNLQNGEEFWVERVKDLKGKERPPAGDKDANDDAEGEGCFVVFVHHGHGSPQAANRSRKPPDRLTLLQVPVGTHLTDGVVKRCRVQGAIESQHDGTRDEEADR